MTFKSRPSSWKSLVEVKAPSLPAGVEIHDDVPRAMLQELAANMRGPDRAEIAAAGVRDPLTAVRMSLSASTLARAVTAPEGVLFIYGVAPASMLEGVGRPWLLGTKALDRYARGFVRHAPRYLAELQEVYPRLANLVDARNVRALLWLKAAGFTIREPIPYGPEGYPFRPFDKGF